MSLLIKALDKAQEKAQDAKVKQAQAEAGQGRTKKAQNKRTKTPKLELAIEGADSALSLSPPQSAISQESSLIEETGFEALEFEADLLPVSLRESAVTRGVASTIAANTGVTSKSAEAAEFKSAEKTAQIQTSANTATLVKATPRTPSQLDPRAKVSSPAQAANVFSAKGVEPTSQNTKLAIIAGAGLIAMLAMGVYYYQFVDSTPDLPMPMRPPQIAVSPPEPVATTPMQSEAGVPESQHVSEVVTEAEATQTFEPREPTQMAQKQKNTANAAPQRLDEENVENTLDENEEVAAPRKKSVKSNMVKMDKAIASESASIQVSQSKPQDAINPTLMRAYDAYNTGNLNDAQKLYKQVLQRDENNVDAMLGLGAIAARQGRTADANGWHRKVLSIEPRNSTAQTAMAEVQQQENPQTGESRIKAMIANSPSDADLHAALGNLYAEQNQWSAAQQAYFDAYRLNESAENAFNLGVSLDQLGKPKLALPYYQQALQMSQQSSTSTIDKGALEARIAAIQ